MLQKVLLHEHRSAFRSAWQVLLFMPPLSVTW